MAPIDPKTEVVLPTDVLEASTFRPESHASWWSIRPRTAGGRLCRERDSVAIGLRHYSQAFATASLASIGALTRTADNRGAIADPYVIRNDCRLRCGHLPNPARTWAAKLPEGIPRLQERLSFVREPIDTLQRFLQQVEDFGGTGPSPNAAGSAQGPTLLSKLFTGTRNFASGLSLQCCFFFSFCVGEIFLHRLEILPRFSSAANGR